MADPKATSRTGPPTMMAASLICFVVGGLVLSTLVVVADLTRGSTGTSILLFFYLSLVLGLVFAAMYLKAKPGLMRLVFCVALVHQAISQVMVLAEWRFDPVLEVVQKLLLVVAIYCAIFPIHAMVSLVRFTGYMAWLRFIGLTLVLGTPAVFLFLVLVRPADVPTIIWQILGVGGILSALSVVGLPLAHLFFGIKTTEAGTSTRLELSATCPRCLTTQTLPIGQSACVVCELKFTLNVEEPKCPECGYLLFNLVSPVCPECGRKLDAREADGVKSNGSSLHPATPPGA